jgi:sialic acid synthase SpsE
MNTAEASANCLVGSRVINSRSPVYFIADIGANHDGSLDRAFELIELAKAAGVDAVKFQHFSAPTIVSKSGFEQLPSMSHQSKWKKSVFDVYRGASIDLNWTALLSQKCDKVGIDFFTSPYSPDLVEHIDPFVTAHKIGSGEITWLEQLKSIAQRGKTVILACGAANEDEVDRALNEILPINPKVILLQCNTNYTGQEENFDFVNLRVLERFSEKYPGLLVGLSDHTAGDVTALGAVALGAKVIEKHFTDDKDRDGPDHGFAMDDVEWKIMIERTRLLERALGDGIKRIEPNEKETVIVQRRSLTSTSDLEAGTILKKAHIYPVRPCLPDGIPADKIQDYVGKTLKISVPKGTHFKPEMFS